LVPPSEAATILAAPTCDHLNEPAKAKLAGQLNRLIWAGPVEVSADDLLRTAAKVERKQSRDEIDKATEWLRDRLKDGPVGSILCAREGDKFLGRRWPDPGMPAEKRRPIVLGRVKWWREMVLKKRLEGESRRAGFNGPYFFRHSNHAWPPGADAIQTTQEVDEAELNPVGAVEAVEAVEATVGGQASTKASTGAGRASRPAAALVEAGQPRSHSMASTDSTASKATKGNPVVSVEDQRPCVDGALEEGAVDWRAEPVPHPF
jgi:hypothetical protein